MVVFIISNPMKNKDSPSLLDIASVVQNNGGIKQSYENEKQSTPIGLLTVLLLHLAIIHVHGYVCT